MGEESEGEGEINGIVRNVIRPFYEAVYWKNKSMKATEFWSFDEAFTTPYNTINIEDEKGSLFERDRQRIVISLYLNCFTLFI